MLIPSLIVFQLVPSLSGPEGADQASAGLTPAGGCCPPPSSCSWRLLRTAGKVRGAKLTCCRWLPLQEELRYKWSFRWHLVSLQLVTVTWGWKGWEQKRYFGQTLETALALSDFSQRPLKHGWIFLMGRIVAQPAISVLAAPVMCLSQPGRGTGLWSLSVCHLWAPWARGGSLTGHHSSNSNWSQKGLLFNYCAPGYMDLSEISWWWHL